ncbi:MAG: T9SS type A sorting domain-containing protein [Balneolales bacterium]|nr:T9SS type A sorting domain-containing protein [Balneolales bacterium]
MYLKYFTTLFISFLTLLIFHFAIEEANAQWNDNPSENLAIIQRDSNIFQPKQALTPDKKIFVSWKDTFQSNGIGVWLQLIDENGELLWNNDGLLIADRPFSSTENYGLATDNDGNALLVFRTVSASDQQSTRISVFKISQSGDFLWGDSGVDITGVSDFAAAPSLTVTEENNIVAAFTGAGFTRIVKLSSDGDILWSEDQSISGSNLALSHIASASDPNIPGASIVMFRTLGSPAVPGMLYIQKFSDEGLPLWGFNPIKLFDTGSLQFGNFPDFITDGSGGAIANWYLNGPLQTFIQHIRADGSLRFSQGGIAVSPNLDRARTNSDIAYDEISDDIFAIFKETNIQQSQPELRVQRIGGEGNSRLWGDNGIVISGHDNVFDYSSMHVSLFNEKPVFSYMKQLTQSSTRIESQLFNLEGEPVWDENPVMISSNSSEKSRLEAQKSASDEIVLIWEDFRDNLKGIFAQNLFSNGTLGPRTEDEPSTQQITFSVNMALPFEQDYFDPDLGDELYIRGSFNDWSASSESLLAPDTNSEDGLVFSITLSLEGEAGESFEYKYFIEAGDGRSIPNDGWEDENAGPGENGNRVLTLTGDDITLSTVDFSGPVFTGFNRGDARSEIVYQMELHQNYPNPFNPSTQIAFTLPENDVIRLEVFSVIGEHIATLADGAYPAGRHSLKFDSQSLTSGIYIYRLQTTSGTQTRKMTLIK